MAGTYDDESSLVAALRRRDGSAFAQLVDHYTPALLRVARAYVPSREAAEDVVQDTWIALIKGIDTFEGRSSLRTWLFSVMINIAKKRGVFERRVADRGGSVDPTRFHGGWFRDGTWKEPPCSFPDTPEGSALANELVTVARHEIDSLGQQQRLVVTLRDLLGFDALEVCELLDISAANQRVLLHRGRAAVREVLERYLDDRS